MLGLNVPLETPSYALHKEQVFQVSSFKLVLDWPNGLRQDPIEHQGPSLKLPKCAVEHDFENLPFTSCSQNLIPKFHRNIILPSPPRASK
jgi:hypothetical protein